MAQRPTEALAEPAREAVDADDLERDRIAWNLPLSAVEEASRRADRTELDTPVPSEKDEQGR